MQNYKTLAVKEKRIFWINQFKNRENSGITQKEFCKQNGLKFETFKNWRVKFSREKRSGNLIELPSEIVKELTPVENGIEITVNLSLPGVIKTD